MQEPFDWISAIASPSLSLEEVFSFAAKICYACVEVMCWYFEINFQEGMLESPILMFKHIDEIKSQNFHQLIDHEHESDSVD